MEAKDAIIVESLIAQYVYLTSTITPIHELYTISEIALKNTMESEITQKAKLYSKLCAARDVRFIFDDP